MRVLRHSLTGLVLCGIILLPQVVSASDLVVIAADNAGAKLQPGQTIGAGSSITLVSGGRVTVLSKSGQVIKLKGPYSGPILAGVADTGPSKLAAVSKLLSAAQRSRTLGATRGLGQAGANNGGDRAALADIWAIAAHRNSAACARSEGLVLWRPVAKDPAVVAVFPNDGTAQKIDWSAGQATQRIAGQAVGNGARLSVLSGARSASIDVSVLPKDIDAAPSGRLLQWMASRGCRDQVRRLARRLHGDG